MCNGGVARDRIMCDGELSRGFLVPSLYNFMSYIIIVISYQLCVLYYVTSSAS